LKKVLVSGCFDLLHAGHIAFFKEAASYGELYVSVGTDKNLKLLKGKTPYFSEKERVYMINSVKHVHRAFLASGSGMLDFEPDLKNLLPDIFIVNADGHTPEKEKLCRDNNIQYIVLQRIPDQDLPARSSSDIKRELRFPFRLCLAGGWVDQPWISAVHPGSVVVAQIWPTLDFNDRSGLATSSRKVALELWDGRVPDGDPIRNALLLFGAENPPGTTYVAGSQDHIGLLLPGVNRLYYDGDFWPGRIDSCVEPEICEWLSRILCLVPLQPRPVGYNPLADQHLEISWIKTLGEAGHLCYESILKQDVHGLGQSMTLTFEMWQKILPHTVPGWVREKVKKYAGHAGAVTSGCGGGYIVIASDKEVEGAIKIKVKY
jgi:cytidyltransferase-like protein